jgi:hypothetical protein
MTAEGGSARKGQRQPRKGQEPLASQWWSQRFTAVLEGYGLGPRMERGRRYARGGRVTDLIVKAGRLEARVQGSRRGGQQSPMARAGAAFLHPAGLGRPNAGR